MGVLNVIHGLPVPPTRSCATFLLKLGRATHANGFSALQMYGSCFFSPIGLHFMDPSVRVNVGHEFSINTVWIYGIALPSMWSSIFRFVGLGYSRCVSSRNNALLYTTFKQAVCVAVVIEAEATQSVGPVLIEHKIEDRKFGIDPQ